MTEQSGAVGAVGAGLPHSGRARGRPRLCEPHRTRARAAWCARWASSSRACAGCGRRSSRTPTPGTPRTAPSSSGHATGRPTAPPAAVGRAGRLDVAGRRRDVVRRGLGRPAARPARRDRRRPRGAQPLRHRCAGARPARPAAGRPRPAGSARGRRRHGAGRLQRHVRRRGVPRAAARRVRRAARATPPRLGRRDAAAAAQRREPGQRAHRRGAAGAGRSRVVDLATAGPSSWRGKLAADFFHPNDAGYAAIADAFEPLVRDAIG